MFELNVNYINEPCIPDFVGDRPGGIQYGLSGMSLKRILPLLLFFEPFFFFFGGFHKIKLPSGGVRMMETQRFQSLITDHLVHVFYDFFSYIK